MVSLDTKSAIDALAISLGGKANRKTIVAGMEELISDGLLQEGAKLPTSKELAEALGVSGGTLQSAMHDLVGKGYLVRRSRKGTYVTKPEQESQGSQLRSNQICLLGSFGLRPELSTFGNAYVFNMLHQAKKYGYEVVLEKSDHFFQVDDEELQAYIDMRAIVALSPDEEISHKLAELAQKQANVIVIGGKIPGRHAGCVYSNNEEICYNVTKEMLLRGHKKICFLVPEKINRRVSYPLRLAGCKRALEEAGLQPPVVIECMSFDDVEKVFAREDHPTAILDVGVSDILYMLERLGKRVPDNVSLVRYDAKDEKTLDGLEVSNIEQPIEEMVDLAMRLLPKLADGGFSLELPHKFNPGQTLIPLK